MTALTLDSFRQQVFARVTACFTLLMFTFVVYLAPTGSALAQIADEEKPIVLSGSSEQKMNQGLLKLQEVAAKKQAKITERLEDEGSALQEALNFFGLSQLTLEDIGDLQELAVLLAEQHSDALANFDKIEIDLIAKNLPLQILQRHRDAVIQYQSAYDDVQQKLESVLAADSLQAQQQAAYELDTLMKGHKLTKSHQKLDPNNLPFGTPDASKTRKPAETAEELSRLTGISRLPQGPLLAANIITPEMLGQLGGPVAEDLAETPDIQFTDAIKAKALELEEDPVKIYNWVRNNIEFIPSYGSIQGADYTLQHGRGNSFDTASLLIALFRVANIPARYAYGTVGVSADKVNNWVGGVDVPEAAQQLLGQGGIPNTAIISGGEINRIKMEHVWVEAWVDYFPSRAARHKVGDSWIPLDGSFKQYQFLAGQDIASNVPFDAQELIDQITQSATVNETEGYIQGIDQTKLESALSDYQVQVESYINNQNSNLSVGDVLGTQKVIVQEFQQLAAGLPYRVEARTHNYSELPDSLRHKFRYTLEQQSDGTESNRLITFEKALSELAGKKLTLSFKPTTEADKDLINSYLPQPDPDTGEIDPDQLPDSLPGYLINLTAEFSEGSEVIESAIAGTMGDELHETLALWSPSRGWLQAVNYPITGEYRAIGLDLQGANVEDVSKLQAQMETTKAILESGDEAQLATLTKNEFIGDLLNATIYSYFSLNDVQDQIQSKISGIVSYRAPSYGLFSTGLRPSYWFGLPRRVSFTGLNMDVDHLSVLITAKDNDRSRSVSYVQSMGMRASAMEHKVPEEMFSTDESPAHGISAVKALAIASQEGQKIWTIDKNNLNVALAAINLSVDTEVELRDAVLAGKIGTAHENQINYNGWVGEGYLLIDPETGAGAYRIAGGANGGFSLISDTLSRLLMILGLGADSLDIAFSGGPFQIISKLTAWFSGIASVVGALYQCTGSDIFVVLVPLIIFVVWSLLLGPAGLALGISFLTRTVLTTLIGLFTAKGIAELTAARCT